MWSKVVGHDQKRRGEGRRGDIIPLDGARRVPIFPVSPCLRVPVSVSTDNQQVLSTPVLVGYIRFRLAEIFHQVASEKKWFIRSLEIAPDHLHLLVEYDANHSIAEVARAFKGRSSNC